MISTKTQYKYNYKHHKLKVVSFKLLAIYMYQPSDQILQNYADVLIKFALRSWEWAKKWDVVVLAVPECAKAMLKPLQKAVLDLWAHPIIQYIPDGLDKHFYENASDEQINFISKPYEEWVINASTHWVRILAEHEKGELKDISPSKLISRQKARAPYKKMFLAKDDNGEGTRTLGLFATPAMAKEVWLTLEEYRGEIIKACYLDTPDPIVKRKENFIMIDKIKNRLNSMSIEYVHAVWVDMDLKVQLWADRKRLWWSGRNIPSFEHFTSPDWRGTNGWIKFNQPLYRYWNLIKGIELHFENGIITKSSATENEAMLQEMLSAPNANKIGEYSLTDKRISRITKFMGETLYDENVGWPFGNTHLAVWSSYRDAYRGEVKWTSEAQREKLWFNDSAIHTDIMSTTDRTVTAFLTDWSEIVIYKDWMFQIDL